MAAVATIAAFFPKDVVPFSNPTAPIVKQGNLACLKFPRNEGAFVEFEFAIPRALLVTAVGYTATNGVKVNVAWFSQDKAIAGAVKWGAEIQAYSTTDLIDPTLDFWQTLSHEATTTTTVQATVPGGLNATAITIAKASFLPTGSATAILASNSATQGTNVIPEFLRLRLRRFGAVDAADTMLGAALVACVELIDN